MAEKNNKFIMLHISNKESKEVLEDAINTEGVERGVLFRTKILHELQAQFKTLKQRGYFPVGIVVDFDDINQIEYLFKRHPNQTKEMKLSEFKNDNPTKL